MSVEKLQKEIGKQSQLLSSLQQRASEAQTRANTAQTRRRELASDALLEGKPVPERDCESLEVEAAKALREAADCEAASARVTKKLSELRRELEIAEREVVRDRVIDLVSQRQRPLSQIDAAVRSLPKAVAELDAIDASIAELFGEVDGARFGNLVQSLKHGSRHRVRQFVESAFLGKHQEELIATQERFSKTITDALTGFSIRESEADTDGLIRYKALNRITGLRSQTINAGDHILVAPHEAEELIAAGSLVAIE